MFLVTVLLVPAAIAVFAPIHPPSGLQWGIGVGIGLYAAIVLALAFGAPLLVVTDAAFHAGRAMVERQYVGAVEVYEGAAAREQRGPALDARAWLLLRGSLPVVKIWIADDSDPVPYWLVSTRRPHELARTLTGAEVAPR